MVAQAMNSPVARYTLQHIARGSEELQRSGLLFHGGLLRLSEPTCNNRYHSVQVYTVLRNVRNVSTERFESIEWCLELRPFMAPSITEIATESAAGRVSRLVHKELSTKVEYRPMWSWTQPV